jgi:glycine/D-amino acid oxidase-like deaminating enzyme/nitrite reductase/ring-hydroxylating ferredoxin subunit
MPRSGSLWVATAEAPTRSQPLTHDASADVCVVGAGIAGLTTAYLLAREGRSVIVVDARHAGGGQTAVTSAHLSCVPDRSFKEILRLHGPDGAHLARESHAVAIDRIEQICNEEHLSCGFERVDGHLFVARNKRASTLDEELDAARVAGASVERLHDPGVCGVTSGACLRFARQAQFHPLEYLAGLAAALERRGGRIFSETKAKEAVGGKNAFVRTSAGHRIQAGAVVVATNSPFNDLVAIHTKQAPYHTYVVGARTPPGAIGAALYWDLEDPYHYARVHRMTERDLGGDNDDAVDILIVGGEDHKAGQAQDADARFERIEHWMRDHFPPAGAVEFRWSGQVMETVDGIAHIGRNPLDADNVYVITGDSGMGLTHGTIGGMLVSDMILHRANPWSELYDPGRVRTGAAVEWVKENLNVALQYKHWLTRGDVESIDEIAPTNGAVIVESGRKIAVYRDEGGAVHRRSAVCPHLGCIVAWNPAASTWDCPCHGSRFDKLGKAINGPAQTDLKKA